MPMLTKRPTLPAPPPSPAPDRITIDPPPAQSADTTALAIDSFARSLRQMMGRQSPPLADLHAEGMRQLARMQPRDAIEELLMSQMLMTHARVVFLNRFANKQTKSIWSDLFHSAADRAANTYRRQMESLAKYRRPRPRRTTITSIRTAHINAKLWLKVRVKERIHH